MKKSEMKQKAKLYILDGFKFALDYANDNSLRYKNDMVRSQCTELYGMILAYRNIGLLSHNEYNNLCMLKTNILIYNNIFKPMKDEV